MAATDLAEELREARLRASDLERQLAAERDQIAQTITAWQRGEDLTRRMSALGRYVGLPIGRWTKDVIIDKIHEWAELYGEPPSAMEWNPAQAKARDRPDVIENFTSGDWPHSQTVARVFNGKWNDAIRAAGYEPRDSSDGYARRMKPQGGRSSLWPEWDGWQIASHLRKRAEMTQGEVAENAKLSVSWIVNMETGRDSNVSIRALLAYAKAIGVRASALIDYEGDSGQG